MPLTRKQQILDKVETSEGSDSGPGASDVSRIYDPVLNDSVDQIESVPAGPTLSRDFTPVGRKTRSLTFESDFRGSGSGGTPPDWGKRIQSCGFKPATLQFLQLNATAPTLGGIMLGEIIADVGLTKFAVVVALIAGGAILNGTHLRVGSGALIVALLKGGPFTGTPTIGGLESVSVATVTGISTPSAVGYQPTSEKSTTITTGAWTGAAPGSLGEILGVEDALGSVIGSVQVIRDNGTGFLNFDVTQLFGSIANGDVLRSAGGGTATISADPVQKRTPSRTIKHNLDGRTRGMLGARGSFAVSGDAGKAMRFRWTFSGDPGAAVDEPPIVTDGLDTVKAPRLLASPDEGALVAYGLLGQVYLLPTKSVAFELNGQVNPNLDANRPGGSTGSNLIDRKPQIKVTVDQQHSGFDWEAARDNAKTVRFCVRLGKVSGNIIGFCAPKCQVTEVAPGDVDGIATFDVTLEPRRYLESGDDEVFFTHL